MFGSGKKDRDRVWLSVREFFNTEAGRFKPIAEAKGAPNEIKHIFKELLRLRDEMQELHARLTDDDLPGVYHKLKMEEIDKIK